MRFSLLALMSVILLSHTGCSSQGTPQSPTSTTPTTPTPPTVPNTPPPTTTDTNPPVLTDPVTSSWAFDRPALSSLRASPKKVFAHYLPAFPRSFDNLPPAADYYTLQYLNPAGEAGKHLGTGGFIRERPATRAPLSGADWEVTDCRAEVLRAAELGLDGFTYDILTTDTTYRRRLSNMMRAAASADPGFKLVLMPDMTAEFGTKPQNLKPYLKELATGANNSSLYRLADGRLVISPFSAQNQTPAWWKATVLDPLAAEGIPIAFLPLFLDWRSNAAAFKSISYGMSDWGSRQPVAAAEMKWWKIDSTPYTNLWMAPVGFSDVRPYNLTYTETEASLGCRNAWNSAIQGKADWAQVVTWNDFAECSEMQPSTGIQTNAYKLDAYFLTWFKTGVAPTIVRDQLMYLHRTHPLSAAPDLSKQTRRFTCSYGNPQVDIIELTGYLTAPGTLSITVDGVTTTRDVGAGLQVMTAPLRLGRPSFALRRNGALVLAISSEWSISDSIIYQDMLYRGADSSMPTGIASR